MAREQTLTPSPWGAKMAKSTSGVQTDKMSIFKDLHNGRHENLFFLQHRESGLKGVMAIHDTTLGPAVGGVMCRKYKSEAEVVHDALRLSESVSLTAALLGCDVGGGKTILCCGAAEKNEAMFRALGAYIQGLGGRFIALADMGVSAENLHCIGKETSYVAEVEKGGVGEFTARGVLLGMKSAAKTVFGDSSLRGRKIALQGLGKVGRILLKSLIAEEARIWVSDLVFEKVKDAKSEFPQVDFIHPNELMALPVDILSPCAVGEILDDQALSHIHCRIIAGSAGNQLTNETIAEKLHEKKILYLPDFLLNAGEVIRVDAEIHQHSEDFARQRLERLSMLVDDVLEESLHKGVMPLTIAKKRAQERVKSIRTLKKIFRPRTSAKK